MFHMTNSVYMYVNYVVLEDISSLAVVTSHIMELVGDDIVFIRCTIYI